MSTASGPQSSSSEATAELRNLQVNVGVRDSSALTAQAFPDVSLVSKGWTATSAFFNGEGDQINIGWPG